MSTPVAQFKREKGCYPNNDIGLRLRVDSEFISDLPINPLGYPYHYHYHYHYRYRYGYRYRYRYPSTRAEVPFAR